ncbi:MAG TPA: hypothetical protein VHZ01_05580 [Casimicrobiaceae bacterium]|nr:hypothetical protein [Casimicrobiaceae bacterium]
MALIAAIAAGAAPLGLANSVSLIPTGFANGYEAFNVNVPTIVDPSALATGAFAGTLDGNPIVFFCFELSQSFYFNPSPAYTYDDSIVSGGKYDELSELFTEGFATALATPASSAAFQLAVWEILEETTPGSLSPGVSQGSFYVTNDYGNTATVTAANALLTGLPSTGAYTIHLLSNADNQNFVYGTRPLREELPEPAPLMLIGAAMIALFGIRRMVATRKG